MKLLNLFKKKPKAVQIEAPKSDLVELTRLRISHTVYPDEQLPFNDYWKYVYDEVKRDYIKRDK